MTHVLLSVVTKVTETAIVGQGGSMDGGNGGSCVNSGKGGSSVDSDGSSVDSGSGMNGVSVLGNYSVESVDSVSGVVDNAESAVGLHKAVLSLDEVSVTVLSLGLDVTGEGVSNTVVVGVLGVGLEITIHIVKMSVDFVNNSKSSVRMVFLLIYLLP